MSRKLDEDLRLSPRGERTAGSGRPRTRPRRSFPCVVATALLTALPGPDAAAQVEPVPVADQEIRAHLDAGRFDQAEAAARALLARIEVEAGPRSPEAAAALDLLVASLSHRGRAGDPEARRLAERAVATKEALFGPGHLETAASLGRLGHLLVLAGEFEDAAPFLERAVAISEERSGPPPHPVLAENLNRLAGLRWWTGDLAAARDLWERTLALRARDLGGDDRRVASILNNLALTATDLGDYAGARRYYERSIDIQERTTPGHPGLANTLSNFGLFLRDLGDLDGAEAALRRSLAIREAVLGPAHPDVAGSLNNLGIVYRARGDLEGALELYQRSLAIKEESLGPEHPWLLNTLNNLGNVFSDRGHHDRALAYHRRALGLRERLYGPDHPEAARTHYSLGDALIRAGRFAEARTHLERALDIRERHLGTEHPQVAWTQMLLAEALWYLRDVPGAVGLARTAEASAREHLRVTARGLAEREALAYAAERGSGLGVLLTAAAATGRTRLAETAWEALVASRALVLDEMAARNRAIHRVDDPEIAALLEEYRDATSRLASHWLTGPGDDVERYRRGVEESRRARRDAGRALADRGAAVRLGIAHDEPTLQALRQALPRRTALVAYARYDRLGPAGAAPRLDGPGVAPAAAYLAFVLPAGATAPLVVPIGPAAEVEERVRRWREEAVEGQRFPGRTASQAEAAYRREGEALRALVWDPVASLTGPAARVFIVPDGALHVVNLAALPAPEGDAYLVEAGPTLHLLSAERDAVRPLPGRRAPGGLLVMGGPDYDSPPPTVSREAEREPSLLGRIRRLADGAAALSPFRGETAACEAFQAHRFPPLPAAAEEARDMARLWRRAGGGAVGLYTGDVATEDTFKRLAPAYRVLHLATHGFLLSGGCRPAIAHENPLLLSGLALARANHRDRVGPGDEDGILTAQEIAAMDLSGTEWAVLSGCDTGVGEIRAGEGVLGLRRAFQVAGVSTLVMTLWRVQDDVARAWTRELYSARFVEGRPTVDAVRDASLALLEARRANGESTHPFHWAAFVAAGDWR